MTEQSKIPLPESDDGKGESSLFERASGAFGLGFRPAPMPVRLDEPPMKRAGPVRRGAQAEPAPVSVAEPIASADA
ncbi:MAG: capsular biosynthesis protein, partial [Tsuneonella sp.]